jgi:PAS domain S-box-containing protein
LQNKNNTDISIPAQCEWVARLFAVAVAALGFAVLAGWAFDIAALKSVKAGWVTMKANTAMGFLLAGTALYLAGCRPGAPVLRHLFSFMAASVALLGLLTLGEYMFGADFGIDQLFFSADPEPGHAPPGRMAVATAAGFTLTGLALVMLDSSRWRVIAQAAALAGNLIGMLAILGYAYDVAALHGVGTYSSVALHTALGLVVVNLGALLVRPRRGLMAIVTGGTSGGVMARQLLPLVLSAPFLIGWLHVEAEKRGWGSPSFGAVLMALTDVILFAVLTLWTAAALARRDLARQASDEQRQRLEAALVEKTRQLELSSALFNSVYDSAPVGLCFIDRDFRYVMINQYLAAINGKPVDAHIGQTLSDVLGELGSAVEDIYRQVFESGQALLNIELSGASPADPQRIEHWLVSYHPVRADDGGIVGVNGVVVDVSARKLYEQRLRESEALFRSIFEHNMDAVLLTTPDGGILAANAEAQRMFGYDEDTLRKIGRRGVVDTTDPRLPIALAQREQSGKFSAELTLVSKSGRKFPADVSSSVFTNSNGLPVSSIIVRDASRRKQAELGLAYYQDNLETMVALRTAALSNAETEQRRLNRALRLLSDGNMVLLRARDENQLLDQLCHMVVQSGGYLMGWVGVTQQDAAKSIRPVARFGDKDGYLDSIRVSWDETEEIGCEPTGTALRTGATQINQDCLSDPRLAPWREAIRKRGYQSIAALPLVIENNVLGALTLYSAQPQSFGAVEVRLLEELAGNMAYGITSLRLRGELERHRRNLEALVEQRTRQIAALNAELVDRVGEAESANRAKSAFLAAMSHEIRTPLNAVIGLAGLLSQSPMERGQRDYADKIELSAQALRILIDDILDFSKIEAGALQLEQAPFSLNTILATTAAIVSVGLEGKPIEALFDIDSGVPDALIGDATRLQQILLNLASNAIKFTERGEVVFAVRCLARGAGSATLQFSVRDTGIGIPAEQMERIFEAFAQADMSTSRQYGGTGLGLAISARLAGLMGGRILVDSSFGRGSEFRFSVTLAVAESAPAARGEGLSGLRVLIVDDHALSRDILHSTCAAFGWRPNALDSGAAGLDELRRGGAGGAQYDILLLDWRMPGMDGIEMLRKANGAAVVLPLVILMAATSELERAAVAGEDLQLDGILAKPVTPASLLAAIELAQAGQFRAILPPDNRSDLRLEGLRLLIAEDNAINQQVIEQILSRAGAEVVIVSSGLAAIEALETPGARFDALLMDIQMPVMDGYTATRIIREEMCLLDLPIIAVTAHAMSEDRERSRRAGMAGHIVKPIDVDDLLDILLRERRGARERPAKPGSQPAAASGIDLPGVDVGAALAIFGFDRAKYMTLLRQFVIGHADDIDEARRLFAAADKTGAAKLIHGLRGMACFLHARALADLGARTADALRNGHAEAVLPLFDEFQAAMLTLRESIARLNVTESVD